MPDRALLIECINPRADHWQLGPLPPTEGRIVLIGWKTEPGPVDAGVTTPIDGILARGATSCARVTFLWSGDPAPADLDVGDVLYRTRGTGGIDKMATMLQGRPTSFTLLSTRSADLARRMFQVTGFDWSEQGQIALLSDAEAPPPELDRQAVVELTSDAWATRCLALSSASVFGALRPGVDGDVAGLFCATEEFHRIAIEALKSSSVAAGAEWITAENDQDFGEQLRA